MQIRKKKCRQIDYGYLRLVQGSADVSLHDMTSLKAGLSA